MQSTREAPLQGAWSGLRNVEGSRAAAIGARRSVKRWFSYVPAHAQNPFPRSYIRKMGKMPAAAWRETDSGKREKR